MFVIARVSSREIPLKSIPLGWLEWRIYAHRNVNIADEFTIACNGSICSASKPTSACYRLLFKINVLHATGRSNFLPPCTCERSREIARLFPDKPVTDTSISFRFEPYHHRRQATAFLRACRDAAHADNAIDDQSSQQIVQNTRDTTQVLCTFLLSSWIWRRKWRNVLYTKVIKKRTWLRVNVLNIFDEWVWNLQLVRLERKRVYFTWR